MHESDNKGIIHWGQNNERFETIDNHDTQNQYTTPLGGQNDKRYKTMGPSTSQRTKTPSLGGGKTAQGTRQLTSTMSQRNKDRGPRA